MCSPVYKDFEAVLTGIITASSPAVSSFFIRNKVVLEIPYAFASQTSNCSLLTWLDLLDCLSHFTAIPF
jgi:hypothetical protein